MFYGSRPGTERVTDRLDDAGFDAVIGNSPLGRHHQTGTQRPRYFSLAPDSFRDVQDPLAARNRHRLLSGDQEAPSAIPPSAGTETEIMDCQGRKLVRPGPGGYKWYELQASPPDEFIDAVERPKVAYQEIQFHSWILGVPAIGLCRLILGIAMLAKANPSRGMPKSRRFRMLA